MSELLSPSPALAPALLPDVELRPGKPPLLQVDAPADTVGWAAAHRYPLRAAVLEHGALLVRGLGLHDVAGSEAVCRRLGRLMIEREAFAARQRHADDFYSASKWPPNQPMCLHHDLSYTLEFPSLLMLACLAAPAEGGATPLADAAAVLEALPEDLVARFERLGWLLIRNYNGEIGASLADAFGNDDRKAVEYYCRTHAICCDWQPDGTLRTWQRRSAIVSHPRGGRRCWFNQIAFLNQWTIEPEVRDYLVDLYGEDGLPFDTRFGNGDPVGPEIVQAINAVYEAQTISDRWQPGDLLLVDNIRTAHGREPYAGQREVLVALADAVKLAECSPTIEIGGD